MTNTKRVSGTISNGNTKRIDMSEIAQIVFDPWGGSWGTSWGSSWLSEQAGAAVGLTKRIPGGISANNTKRVTL